MTPRHKDAEHTVTSRLCVFASKIDNGNAPARYVWYSNLFDRSIYAVWVEQGARDFQERLREQTEQVVQHKPPPLPEAVAKEMARMAVHWK